VTGARILHRIGTAVRLPGRQPLDAIELMCVAATVELGLRLTRLPRLCRVLGVHLELGAPPASTAGLRELALSERERERLDVGWRVLRRRPFNGTCLRRAMLAGFILRRRDHAVRIGVRKADGVVAAHAWLELDGISLDPDSVEDFHTLEGAA
jgi:hypothetical protein